ncbi:uncharacterized protein [Amphiura filiformis]|uniref:uncharacterized protein n=1 Tax=Amphiura filiformis TaxID=82378 RepID=UPI003B216947
MCYTRSDLLKYNTGISTTCRLPQEVWYNIKSLGLNKQKPTRRGKKKILSNNFPIMSCVDPSASPAMISHSNEQTVQQNQCEHSSGNHSNMKLGLWNAQSVGNKGDTITDIILNADLDFFFLTETWLRSDDRVITGQMCPPGYSFLGVPRNSVHRGGGTACVFKSQVSLEFCEEKLPKSDTFEHSLFYMKNQNLYFVVVYRSSSLKQMPQYFHDFEIFLNAVDLLPGRSVVLGDFNIHMDMPNENDTKSMLAILESLSFEQLVDEPTHVKGHTLDLVMVKENDHVVKPYDIHPVHVSDHFLILCDIDFKKQSIVRATNVYKARNFRNIDPVAFEEDLVFKLNTTDDSMDEAHVDLVQFYNKTCSQVLETHAPAKEKPCTVRIKPEWFNQTVQDARRLRRRSERRWRKTRTEVDRQAYIDSQREAATTISKEKASFYNERLLNCNTKDMYKYKTINALLNKTSRDLPDSSSPATLANDFCKYFIGKVETIRADVDAVHATSSNTTSQCSTSSTLQCSFDKFEAVSEEELSKIITPWTSKSCDLDPLPTWLLKKHIHIFLPILTKIVNNSLLSGCFPAELRRATITPVLKKVSLDKQQLSNYRPVSNLAFVGKLIEKVVSVQLTEYVECNKLAEPLQSAYRAAHSTETALIIPFSELLMTTGLSLWCYWT